jgi:DNA-binding NtrC family response regulator
MSTIVVYEEDDLMRGLLEEWLKSAGYHVCTHPTHGVPPTGGAALVIASITMPKHAGVRRVGDITAKYPRTPLIAISAQFRAGLAAAGTTAQTLGAAQVIAKPLTRDALLRAVTAIIGPAT